jgi:4-hydroxy-4-methyl-2-oxoglutarate aldolase
MSAGTFEQRLARLDCCAVSDALDKLGIARGYVGGLPRHAGTRSQISGRVVTYRLVAAGDAPPVTGKPRHLGTTAIELAAPGNIIVVEQRTGIDAGSWGGILSLAAHVKGIGGLIADGPVRDIDEARTYDFPVFSRGLTARTARGRVAEVEVNQTVQIGDVQVNAGDYVIADGSGVVFIAEADIERVLQAAEMISGREAAMAKALLAGEPVTDVMGANYEHMLK